MNTHLNVVAMTSAVLLLGLAWTGNTNAQQSQLDMPRPGTGQESCDEVNWHRNMTRDYPWVADGCHEVVVVDGEKWARFEAEFQELNQDGTITTDFIGDNGRSMGTVNLMPGPNQRVNLDGRPTRFSELRRGQLLNFYAPEGSYAFTTEPGSTEQVQIVQVQDQDARRTRELAQAEPARETRRNTLPATAGPLPMIALGGLLSLLGGISLTMRRRLTTPDA